KMRIPDHRIERRAQFVREHRQELVLEPACSFELFSRGLLARKNVCALGSVGTDAEQAFWPAVLVAYDLPHALNPPHRTVRPDDSIFDVMIPLLFHRRLD